MVVGCFVVVVLLVLFVFCFVFHDGCSELAVIWVAKERQSCNWALSKAGSPALPSTPVLLESGQLAVSVITSDIR